MSALGRYIALGLRLHARNRMALVYSYLFPTIFLVAFAALYRYDRIPLAAHIGELLTITTLGGACFGLPTTLVSERERGVWRRYRLLPTPMPVLIAGTLATRLILLAVAAALQLALAASMGFPGPEHWLDLLVAFTAVSIALMGLGLLIAATADTVPAVQALGQCVFLPMLIIGGVAVPLAALPEWAQRVSFFLPGRYAVQAIQAAVTGGGLRDAMFSVAALLVIGTAAVAAGGRLFRWDTGQRFTLRQHRWWLTAALAPWIGIGLLADAGTSGTGGLSAAPAAAISSRETPRRFAARAEPTPAERSAATARETGARDRTFQPAPPGARETGTGAAPPPTPSPMPSPTPSPPPAPKPASMAEIEAAIAFDRLPPDNGVITPIALNTTAPADDLAAQLDALAAALDAWPAAREADVEQRVRNLLYVPAVVDLQQLPAEPYVPLVVFDRLRREIGEPELVQVLFHIGIDWMGGRDDALDSLTALALGGRPENVEQVRNRAAIYAVKLLGRITGHLRQ